MKPVVSIVMGSRSDLPTMKATGEVLKEFGLAYEIRIMSAHRTPVGCAIRLHRTMNMTRAETASVLPTITLVK